MAVSPSLIAEAVGWRREFHAAPELGYQEQETSRRVAELLASFGLQVHRGLAGTGVGALPLPPLYPVVTTLTTSRNAAAARRTAHLPPCGPFLVVISTVTTASRLIIMQLRTAICRRIHY